MGSPLPGGGSAPPPIAPDPARLDAFLARCEQGAETWRAGQVDYPRSLPVSMGGSASYVAAVDVRDEPLPAEEVIPGADPFGEPVAVKCVLAARLTTVGDSLEVDEQEWIFRSFTPTGVVNWSWSVTARAPGDHDLRLEIEPAVALDDLHRFGSSPNTTTFVTRVSVDATWLQRAGEWWKGNWDVVALIAAAVGAALVGVVKWGGELGTTFREALAKWRTPTSDSSRDPHR